MYQFKYLLTILVVISLFLSSCSKRHVKHKTKYRDANNYTSTMAPANSMRDLDRQSRSVNPDLAYTSSMTPAHNMNDLDRQSRSVKPHLIYSYPKSSREEDANFVNLDPIKYKVLNYINNIRAKGNSCGPSAPPLTWNKELEDAAISHAQDMSSKNFLGHMGSGSDTDPAKKAPGQGSNFYERIIYFGYPIKPQEVAGEIITYTKFRVVGNQAPYEHFTHAVNNFLHSPKHCSILMNPRFHDIGVASYKDNEKMFWVIEFAEVNY